MLEKKLKRCKHNDTGFYAILNEAWKKLKEYYEKIDNISIYIIVIILNKLQYFWKKWPANWMREIERKVETIYNEFKILEENTSNKTSITISMTAAKSIKEVFDIYNWHFGDMNVKDNELRRYLDALILRLNSKKENEMFELIKWWKTHEKEYPTLAHITYDLFIISCSSIKSERIFSGYLINPNIKLIIDVIWWLRIFKIICNRISLSYWMSVMMDE